MESDSRVHESRGRSWTLLDKNSVFAFSFRRPKMFQRVKTHSTIHRFSLPWEPSESISARNISSTSCSWLHRVELEPVP
jgi:hypothetical protein